MERQIRLSTAVQYIGNGNALVKVFVTEGKIGDIVDMKKVDLDGCEFLSPRKNSAADPENKYRCVRRAEAAVMTIGRASTLCDKISRMNYHAGLEVYAKDKKAMNGILEELISIAANQKKGDY